ncbi:hypothetical protein B0T10DRAFT_611640 [Thelonectria olida]|uniref:Uncharacterized protein n=1 Tax=Thelonectria olida TaxID=1576542 RepID=A0A9P8VP44_9HYPO|nr:hypothetical protein B0T10DRAFT_611640 [Thelonectria olida]
MDLHVLLEQAYRFFFLRFNYLSIKVLIYIFLLAAHLTTSRVGELNEKREKKRPTGPEYLQSTVICTGKCGLGV